MIKFGTSRESIMLNKDNKNKVSILILIADKIKFKWSKEGYFIQMKDLIN